MWTKTADGTVVDQAGKIIFFSNERFVRDICIGNCCFICGADPAKTPFNDEHILPEWLLRRYGLFGSAIALPNGASVRYDRYTVPCCASCNALMGEEIERPISEIVRSGSITDFLLTNGNLKFFVWMGLIFLKTHLKDRSHRFHLDARKGSETLADDYEWALLHHIHTIVRCFYTGSQLAPNVLGSFVALPVGPGMSKEPFDFGDLYYTQTMLIRLDDVALLAVFNDAGGSLSYFQKMVERFSGPLSDVQLREVMAELAFLNLHLKHRPKFTSWMSLESEEYVIDATLPKLELQELQWPLRGRLLQQALGNLLPHLEGPERSSAETEEAILSGELTFLFNDKGQFVTDGIKGRIG